jgi:hypothetical protein
LADLLVEILRDWCTCLDLSLYDEAVAHFLGGEPAVLKEVDVLCNGSAIGLQTFRLLKPDTAFKITSFDEIRPRYEASIKGLLEHTPLRQFCWINIGRRKVTFTTLSK